MDRTGHRWTVGAQFAIRRGMNRGEKSRKRSNLQVNVLHFRFCRVDGDHMRHGAPCDQNPGMMSGIEQFPEDSSTNGKNEDGKRRGVRLSMGFGSLTRKGGMVLEWLRERDRRRGGKLRRSGLSTI